MTTIGRDTNSPFHSGPDLDVAARHRPTIDDETMLRLRTPFRTPPPDDTPHPQHTTDPQRGQPHRDRAGLRPHPGGDEG
ncbi:MAG TPA: hypothetical protein VFG35_20100 [Actinoplanes sp.]|nr:hypothetical protein [Actinoplanes sp.]